VERDEENGIVWGQAGIGIAAGDGVDLEEAAETRDVDSGTHLDGLEGEARFRSLLGTACPATSHLVLESSPLLS